MNLNNLRFADDVVLVGKNKAEISSMAEDLRRESEKMGLTINFTKTKVMSNLESLAPITVGGETIERVSEYRYLGQILSLSDKME